MISDNTILNIAVYHPGSNVRVSGLDATVLQVILKANLYVQYEVAWTINGDRKTAWVEEFEVEFSETPRYIIGFKERDLK